VKDHSKNGRKREKKERKKKLKKGERITDPNMAPAPSLYIA